jgi:hypothetical protein
MHHSYYSVYISAALTMKIGFLIYCVLHSLLESCGDVKRYSWPILYNDTYMNYNGNNPCRNSESMSVSFTTYLHIKARLPCVGEGLEDTCTIIYIPSPEFPGN